MKIRSIGRHFAEELKFRSYPRLNQLVGIAVDGLSELDYSVSRKLSGGKRELEDWADRKVDALKRRLLIYSEAERMAREVGFVSLAEARAAVKAVRGNLDPADNIRTFTGLFPVFVGISSAFQAEKTAYIHFLAFLGEVGKGNLFTSIDSSQEALLLFHRARMDGVLMEVIKNEASNNWVVSKDPIAFLREKTERLPASLKLVF